MYLGQEKFIFGKWFLLHFTENNGMAFGLELGGIKGKLFLTIFRIVAIFGILYYLLIQIKKEAKMGLVICISLVLAGAMGNIVDSVFYGVWFKDNYNDYLPDGNLRWADHAPYFYGRVVDMLYFPMIEGRYPNWFPIWGGESFLFFRPVFNIADASISTGVFSIILFQKKLFPKTGEVEDAANETVDTTADVSIGEEASEIEPKEEIGDEDSGTDNKNKDSV